MPTLAISPSTSRPVPKRENLLYCVIPTEYVLDGGSYAEATVEFNGTAYASGQSFIFAGVEFTTSNSAPTFNSFEIGVNAGLSAQNFIDALNLNAAFFGKIQTSVTGGGVVTLTVTWLEIGEQPNFTFDYSGLSPALVHTETNGTAALLREGFKLRYQLWGENADGMFPVTNVEAVTPRVTGAGTIPRICLNFREDVKGLVSTTFPSLSLNDLLLDEAFAVQVFLKYGAYQVNDCVVTEWGWLSSDPVWLLNAVVQIDDADKLTRYVYPDANPAKFLTVRPESVKMPEGSLFWLWIYATRLDNSTFLNYRANWEYFDADGVSLGTFNSASAPTENGVYIIPAGPGNSPGMPVGTVRIDVQLQVYNNDFAAYVGASEVYSVQIGHPENCGTLEFYFLEDLGAYSTIHFQDFAEVTHVVENQVFSLPEVAADSLYDRDLSSRLLGGGYSRANIKSWNVYKATTHGLDSPELERYFRQFRDSENILFNYTSETGDAVVRKIILEPGEAVIRRDGEYLTLEILFRFHTDLR